MASTFQALDTVYLVGLLAKQTSAFIKYKKEGLASQEFELCKAWIRILKKEIKLRKQPGYIKADVNIEF